MFVFCPLLTLFHVQLWQVINKRCHDDWNVIITNWYFLQRKNELALFCHKGIVLVKTIRNFIDQVSDLLQNFEWVVVGLRKAFYKSKRRLENGYRRMKNVFSHSKLLHNQTRHNHDATQIFRTGKEALRANHIQIPHWLGNVRSKTALLKYLLKCCSSAAK